MTSFSFSRTTGLLFVVGLLFAGIGNVLIPANVNAVANPVFTKTDELELKNASCEVIASTLWRSAIMDSTTITPEQKTMFTNAEDNGYWAITQDRLSETVWNAYVYFLEDNTGQPDPTLKLENGPSNYRYYLEHADGVGHRRITISLNSECEFLTSWSGNNFADLAGNPGSADPDRLYNFLVSTDVILDAGIDPEWVGEIKHEYTPPEPETVNAGMGMSPAFRYDVDEYDITLTDITNPEYIDEFNITECMFQVPNNTYGDNFTEYAYDCDLKTSVQHTFTEYASYNILHRMYSETDDLWYETSQIVKIDGTTYSSTAGLDQSGTFISDILKRLTVPTFGLQSALVAPIEFVKTIPELAGVCSPITAPLPFVDSDLTLPCMTPIYQNHFNSFLILWQVSLTALVSYATVNKVFDKLRQTYNPRQDRIEPTNL